MNKPSIPFVGLHAHSVAGSIFDGLGYPNEHMDYAHENGMDALALTDHGNMNGLPYAVLHAKKMHAEGKNFKPIFGCEAYFIPSIKEWREEYNRVMQDKKAARAAKKDETSGATVEDENASKKAARNILNRRRHLVLLAQNQTGLNNLFKLISESYRSENFYRYPRIDFDLLEKYGEGIIASSACLGGVYAGAYWENREEGPEAVLRAMRGLTERFVSILGDRWYGELQWNNVPEQHDLNKYIIQVCGELNVLSLFLRLILTILTQRLGRIANFISGWVGLARAAHLGQRMGNYQQMLTRLAMNFIPKNGNQMWEAYQKYSSDAGVKYDDDLVMASLVKTYEIAHERIEAFMPDNTVRLPDFVIPVGETEDSALRKFCFEGLRSRNLHDNQEYTDRLEHELSVIY
jgi:DNA polymerase-3 subunit alpha